MADNVKLTIDGVSVKAPAGANLIDAAELAGIHIPNLCYLKGLKGIGACRLCLVQVEGGKGPVIACNTKVKEGMAVQTTTDEIREQRKFVIDLILSMHPLDCMTCPKSGACNLQSYAYDFNIKQTSFTLKRFGFPVEAKNPFIKMLNDYCILCGRCIRVCKEQDTNVLEFMGRGVGSKVSTATDRPMQEAGCTFCGSCVDVCPVNALIEADRSVTPEEWETSLKKGREWEFDKTNSVCMLCGDSCGVVVCSKDGRIQKVNSAAEEGSPSRYICAYGRFGYDMLESETRIMSPMVREGGQLKEASWDKALALVAEKLKGAGNNAGIISTAGITNEDALSLKSLSSDVIKTENVDTTMSLYADAETLTGSDVADIDDADLIVAVGIDPSQWARVLPKLDASIRRKAARGAGLIVINSSETKLDASASVKIAGDEVSGVKSLIKAALESGASGGKDLSSAVSDAGVTEEAAKGGELLNKAVNPIIYASPSLFGPASDIALIKGKAVAVSYESNARGVALAGLKGKGKAYGEMASSGAAVLYAIGSVPVENRPKTDFLIVQDSHLSALAKEADVVLPSATYLEASGSLVDYSGNLIQLSKAVEPAGKSKSHTDIFIALSKAMGKALAKPKAAAVKTGLKGKAKRAPKPFEKKGADVQPSSLIESLNLPVIRSSRITWLMEAEKAAV